MLLKLDTDSDIGTVNHHVSVTDTHKGTEMVPVGSAIIKLKLAVAV